MATSNMGYQSFFQTTLSSNISDTDLTIPLTSLPTPTEGYLVIESTVAAKREIIYYTSKTASAVVCPAGGRGYDGTTAVSHTQNASVIMAPVGKMFSDLRDLFETTPQGWTSLSQTVSSVTNNGNRSYDVTFNSSVASLLSPGMRLRTTRTVAAPTQCTSLNGSSQYYSKTSPTGLTFTTTFTCSAWVKLSSYAVGGIIARRNGDTEGWSFTINASGQLSLVAQRIAGNRKILTSYQSIPLNKWVHVAGTLDMTVGDTTAQKLWIDGIEVARLYTLDGTATALVQGTTALVVGARLSAGTDLFSGKIAQAAVFSSQLSEATIRSQMAQGLSGTESTLVSAYSFNGNATDLNTTNANDLTANGSAVATNADSPFGGQGDGTISSTLDYGIVTKVASAVATIFLTNGTIPTSGGVSSASYSSQKSPYNFPANADVSYTLLTVNNQTLTTETDLLGMTTTIDVPANAKLEIRYRGNLQSSVAGDVGSLLLYEDANLRHQTFSVFRNANNQENPSGYLTLNPTSGSHTYKLRAKRDIGTGTLLNAASVAVPCLLEIKVANF